MKAITIHCHCPYCDSENIYMIDEDEHSIQFWECGDCSQHFSEHLVILREVESIG